MTAHVPLATPNKRAWREAPDMLLATVALQRAAQKAKLLAEQTGTPYVVSELGESVSATQQPLAGMTQQAPSQVA